jgi:hypothetical protein
MRITKLSLGVLRVLTPLGPRYLNPSFVQRLYLRWIFRNFDTLSFKVLSLRQQRRLDAMCARQGLVSVLDLEGPVAAPLLGTLEQRSPVASQRQPNRIVSDAEKSPFAAKSGG